MSGPGGLKRGSEVCYTTSVGTTYVPHSVAPGSPHLGRCKRLRRPSSFGVGSAERLFGLARP